jgi:hypothetical protein
MTISDRYRQIVELVVAETDQLRDKLPVEMGRALRSLDRGVEELQELREQVGEIPQIQLENKLSPVLLKAHGSLDRARVELEEHGFEREGAVVWELEQLVYRLLNDL